MATVRYLVKDVDASLPFYEALGFKVTERWGPPFVMLARDDLTLWPSGPGTSQSRCRMARFLSPVAGIDSLSKCRALKKQCARCNPLVQVSVVTLFKAQVVGKYSRKTRLETQLSSLRRRVSKQCQGRPVVLLGQTANPSIERTASGLRPPAAAHVKR